MMGNSFISIG